MCGIAGFLTTEGSVPDQGLGRRMCDLLEHRGPDGWGLFTDGEAALGHRRLSIIDLAGGRQPLGNEDGSVQISFNGEIYNYQELHAGLVQRGHGFQTRSDTEVIVHLYEEVGERVAEYLNGMFAFAIWDANSRQLLLARDRMGKKPVYYREGGTDGIRFSFASELKALSAVPGFDDELSAEALADYLALGYVPDPASIYRGVRKLAPAHTLTVSADGTVRTRRYWRAEFHAGRAMGEAAAAEQVRELANDATRLRLISDVPLGAFLSGGVDSSAVVGMMAGNQTQVKSFSIGFSDRAYDELEYARIIAERYHTEHHEQVVTPSIEEMFGRFIEHYDEPFADSSAIPTLYLARMTRQNVTVALSGDGADEIFAGYRLYVLGAAESRMRGMLPDWFRTSAVAAAGRWYPKLDFLPRPLRAKSFLTNLSRSVAEAHYNTRAAFSVEALERLLSPELRRELGGYRPVEKMRGWFERVRELAPLEQMQAVDIETYLPGDILVKMDRATMAYSLEARAPLLDYRLVELAGTIPWQWKVNGRVGKYIFKKAVERYVPEQLIRRPKMGFVMPMREWLSTSLKPLFEELVLRPEMDRYLNREEVSRLWRQHQSGLSNHDRKLWTLLSFAAWHSRWVERDNATAAALVAARSGEAV